MNQATTPSTALFLIAFARANIASFLLLPLALFLTPFTTAYDPGERHCMMGCPTHQDTANPPIDWSRDGFRHGRSAAFPGSGAVSLSVPNQVADRRSAAAV